MGKYCYISMYPLLSHIRIHSPAYLLFSLTYRLIRKNSGIFDYCLLITSPLSLAGAVCCDCSIKQYLLFITTGNNILVSGKQTQRKNISLQHHSVKSSLAW